ncbi:hypothetical protein NC652_024322 [Populus alba x Populus x berolinensis]|nr:hypothetical protein NC652_024322 [Populus alba x Populus x berolinensis]
MGYEDQDLVFGKPVRSITAMDYLVQEKSELPKSCTRRGVLFYLAVISPQHTCLRIGQTWCLSCPFYHFMFSNLELVRDRKADTCTVSIYPHYSGQLAWQHIQKLNFWELDAKTGFPFRMKNGNPEFD